MRAQLGRFGFSGDKATTQVGKLSGGERARLALALITRDAPHMLILDEPTNHLDVDAREALVQALNDYTGAVVIVSHDRHMLELTADRLVLVDDGTAQEYDGSARRLYRLRAGRRRRSRRARPTKVDKKEARRARRRGAREGRGAAQARAGGGGGAGQADRAAQRDRPGDVRSVDAPTPSLAKLTMTELMKRRADIERKIEAAESAWLEVSEALETIDA